MRRYLSRSFGQRLKGNRTYHQKPLGKSAVFQNTIFLLCSKDLFRFRKRKGSSRFCYCNVSFFVLLALYTAQSLRKSIKFISQQVNRMRTSSVQLATRQISSTYRTHAQQVKGYHEVSYLEKGEPLNVLQLSTHDDAKTSPFSMDWSALPSTSWVCVEMKAVPWNPADMNSVQGTYASPYDSVEAAEASAVLSQSHFSPKRTVAGSSGIGVVSEMTASKDNRFAVGDWVTVAQPGLGTMRSSVWAPASSWIKISRGSELFEKHGDGISTIFQLGGTALRMLRDFQVLRPGDCVIQNAGNSGVGWMASQLAAAHDVSMVSLVRRGTRSAESFNTLVDHLKTKGRNTRVIAEEDLCDQASMQDFRRELQLVSHRPRVLALNAVGGDSAGKLLKLLDRHGTLVTYGGMSMKPLSISAGHLIFQDIKVVGYWNSRWMLQHSLSQQQAMTDELVDLVLSKEIVGPPVRVFPLSDFQQGIKNDLQQGKETIRNKVVFDVAISGHQKSIV